MIGPGADRRGGVRQDASSMETLKLTDYESIKDECTYISAISPTVTKSGQFIYGNENTPSTIYGVNPDYLTIRQLNVSDGVMFTDNDIKSSAKVCILGQTVVGSQEELASMMTSTSDMLTILLGCVAGISLIVGGIGIMNIM